jgi:DHA2 family multidrug resistance protein
VFAGAPSTPLAQSILMGTFPRRQHAMAMGLFGFGVVIGPVIGPTLGGYMAEEFSWRYAFFALFPVGVIGVVCLRVFLPSDKERNPRSLDWTGFLALSVALAATQLVLARGQQLDWFESVEISVIALVGGISFWIFAAHTLTTKHPFLNPRHLLNRNYAIGLALVTLYGMLNFTLVVLLPPLLKAHVNFPDSLVGEIVASRGFGGCIGFLIGGFMGRLDPRLSMSAGFGMLLIAGLWLMAMDFNSSPFSLAANAALQGVAAATLWVPLTVVTFSNIADADRAETSAVFHLLRNLGSSFFISICVTELVHSTSTNYSRMIEFVSPYNPAHALPWVVGAWDMQSPAGLQQVANEITRQSALIAHLNVFGMFSLVCALAIPLIFLIGKSQPKLADAGMTEKQQAAS